MAVGSAAGCIDAADQATHAGAGDQVHGHMVLIEPLQHANVRQAERPAPFEYQADLRPRLLVGSLRGNLRLQWKTNQESKQENKSSRSPESSADGAAHLLMAACCWIHGRSIIADRG
jgi:hypothetical protein